MNTTTQEQILSHLQRLTEGQEQLFAGQKQLFEGYERLSAGQEQLFAGQKQLFENQQLIVGTLEKLARSHDQFREEVHQRFEEQDRKWTLEFRQVQGKLDGSVMRLENVEQAVGELHTEVREQAHRTEFVLLKFEQLREHLKSWLLDSDKH
jgi:uncharacterized phage infection (PIP) family protein YhgE